MSYDPEKQFVTAPDGTVYQVLDENGCFDGPATAAAYEAGEAAKQ